jgi:hypothetical protein
MILLLSDSQVDGVGFSEPDFGAIFTRRDDAQRAGFFAVAKPAGLKRRNQGVSFQVETVYGPASAGIGVTTADGPGEDFTAAVTFSPELGAAAKPEFKLAARSRTSLSFKHFEHKISVESMRRKAGLARHRVQSGGAAIIAPSKAPSTSSLAACGASQRSQNIPPSPSRVAGISPHSSHGARVWSAATLMPTLRLLRADYRIDRMTDQHHA